MKATTDPTLAHPRLAPEPGPLRLPAPSVVAIIAPAPKFPAPNAAAAPVELHQFAAATTKLALQPSPGALKPSGFGGPQSQSITVQASGPVQLAGFAGPDRSAAVAAASGGSVQTGNFGRALASGASGLHGTAAATAASAGFDLTALPPRAAASETPAEPAYIPVEILFKPVPEYSAEGRRLGIQGEVVLAVLFQINGQLRVARVVHSLGHGLDEAAVRAAEEIRFRPAQRNGAPIATAAMIRVTFQLAQ
jgi:TonB family protein